MPRVGERILVTQSPCARDASLRALSKEVTEKESRGGRARVPSVASYPRTVSGATRTVRDTCSTVQYGVLEIGVWASPASISKEIAMKTSNFNSNF